MKQLTDELLNEFSQGSPHAFQAIFDSFRMRIFYFVKNLIDDRLTAEEITSDTFVKLYRLHDKFNTLNNIQAFLFITARNASLDFLKYRQRQRQHQAELQQQEAPDTDVPLFAELNMEAEVLQFIHKEIETLPPRGQRVVKLFLAGMSTQEIADIMDIRPRTVINLKNNSIKSLRMKVLNRLGSFLGFLFFIGGARY